MVCINPYIINFNTRKFYTSSKNGNTTTPKFALRIARIKSRIVFQRSEK